MPSWSVSNLEAYKRCNLKLNVTQHKAYRENTDVSTKINIFSNKTTTLSRGSLNILLSTFCKISVCHASQADTLPWWTHASPYFLWEIIWKQLIYITLRNSKNSPNFPVEWYQNMNFITEISITKSSIVQLKHKPWIFH